MKPETFKKLSWLVILLGITVRIPLLDGSLWLDEAAQALESARPLTEQFDIIADFQPPLLHLILHFVQYFSHAEAWMRLWGAFIPGIITLIVTLFLFKKVFDKKTALLTTLFLSLSSFHVYFSQELRPYALPAMWAALSWWVLITATEDTSSKQTQKTNYIHWLLFGIVTWLGLFSSYLYPFLILGQIVYVLAKKQKSLSSLIISLTGTSLAYIPWLPTFFQQLTEGRSVQTRLPGWSEVVSIPQLKSIPLTFGKFIYGVLRIDATPFFIITSTIIALSSTFLLYHFLLKYKKRIFTKKNIFLLAWFVIPLCTAWLISFIVPVVRPKRMLLIQPALLGGIAYLITWALSQKVSRVRQSAWLLLGTVLCIFAISLFSYYTDPTLQREDWRSLHSEILSQYPQRSVVVFSFTEPFAPWRWYDNGLYPTFSTGALTVDSATDLTNRIKYLTQYDFILVFDHLRTLTDPKDELIGKVKDFGYTQIDLIDYPNIGFVRVFAKTDATISESTQKHTSL